MLNRSAVYGVLAAVVALVTDALYLAIIVSEGNNPIVGVVGVIAAIIGLAGVGAGVGALAGRPALLWSAAAVLAVMGVLGIFSIGLPLLVAAGLAATGAPRAGSSAAQLPQR